MKKWEKIFIAVNIIFILGCFCFYGYRAIHYYKLNLPNKSENKLVDYILDNDSLVYKNDGLYQASTDNYYYKGTKVKNYVYYSGRIWRIVSIGDTIKLIADENQTSLVWGLNNNYNESLIKNYLENEYLNTLNKDLLSSSTWCIDSVKLDNLTCDNKIESNIGLLSISDYLKSGGKDGFINNKTYWWTINASEEKVWYIFNDGGINDNIGTFNSYYSYGVRPVVNLKKDIVRYSGIGTIDDPFIIESTNNVLLKDNYVGSYVTYNNSNWRILEKSDKGVKLILDGVLEEKTYTEINSYLNEYIKDFDTKDLVKCDFETFDYSYDKKYSLKGTMESKYIGLPNISDLFINDYNDYWLNTKMGSLIYSTTDYSVLADTTNNKHKVRPVICLNNEIILKSGNGTKKNPLVIGEA